MSLESEVSYSYADEENRVRTHLLRDLGVKYDYDHTSKRDLKALACAIVEEDFDEGIHHLDEFPVTLTILTGAFAPIEIIVNMDCKPRFEAEEPSLTLVEQKPDSDYNPRIITGKPTGSEPVHKVNYLRRSRYNSTNDQITLPEITPEFVEDLKESIRSARKHFREATKNLEVLSPEARKRVAR